MPVKISVSIPFGIGKVEWTPSDNERKAAWALYVEYSTRITFIKGRFKRRSGKYAGSYEGTMGSARLAMNSLYELMNVTRGILREAGPDIAKSSNSLGPLSIRVLNNSVRKILDDYHTSLEAHEYTRDPNEDRSIHEKKWEHYDKFCTNMLKLQEGMKKYILALEVIAGVANCG
jgi:hypothetical protein